MWVDDAKIEEEMDGKCHRKKRARFGFGQDEREGGGLS